MVATKAANQITAANAGKRFGFAGKSRVGLSPRPGVAEFHRWANTAPHHSMSNENRKVIRDSDTFWQLDGESDLYAVTIPTPPKSGAGTTVRLTHSNSYGPFDEAEFFVRVGDPDKPTDQDDLDSA